MAGLLTKLARVPLLMLMLDDPDVHTKETESTFARGFNLGDGFPPRNEALSAIGVAMGSMPHYNLARGGRGDLPTLDEEVEAVKRWWSDNGEAFIAGEATADPPPQ